VQGCDLDLHLTLLASKCSNVAISQIKLVHTFLSFCCKYCMCLAFTLSSNWTSHDQVMAGLQSVSILSLPCTACSCWQSYKQLAFAAGGPTQRFLHTAA